MKNFVLALLLFSLGAGGTYATLYFKRRETTIPASPKKACADHKLITCPFCDKSLIEKLGECGAHKVPEALCSRCDPRLISAFKAEFDWCQGHQVPESQCELCGANK